MPADQYQNIDGMDYAMEKDRAKAKRSMWITIGVGALVLALIGVGVGVGVSVAKKHSTTNALANGNSGASNSGNSGSSSGGGGGSPGASPTTSDPNDPSNFTKDPRLHKSLYGIAYTPDGSIMPDCGATLDSIIRDVQIMSQLTSRLRLYGSDCNQTALVLEAIKQTKVDMKVYLGNYVEDGDPTAYTRQRDVMKQALQTYGVDNVLGVTVGNEYMLNYLTDKGASDPNSAVGNTGAAILIADIKDTRDMLTSLNLPTTIPVGTSDAGSYFNNEVLEAVDYGMSNVHAWFAQVTADQAAAWVFDFFNETNVAPAAALPNQPKMFIAETGWPTNSSDAEHMTNGPGTAAVSGLQTFLDTFVCQANSAGIGYFFFEFFDEEWKDKLYGGVEGYWGLFDKNRNLKDVTIPNCISP